jgi:hypothetical protein
MMATRKDEFDPPAWVLLAVVDKIVIPVLLDIAKETGVHCLGSVAVCIEDEQEWKLSIRESDIIHERIDENAQIRLRFRRTFRDDRVLFAMDTQHADVWRRTGFSGVWLHGDVIMNDGKAACRIRRKTICYGQGWHNW